MTWETARKQKISEYKPPKNIRKDKRLLFITIKEGRYPVGTVLKLSYDDNTGAPEFTESSETNEENCFYVNWFTLEPHNFDFNE